MRLDISFRTGRSEAKVEATDSPVAVDGGKIHEALDLIKSSYLETQTPLQDPGAKAAKLAWVGGAIRVLSIFSGRPASELQVEVTGSAPPATIPSPTNRYGDLVDPSRPVKPQRPAPHPGAQRKLSPEELEKPPAEPDDSVSITSKALKPRVD